MFALTEEIVKRCVEISFIVPAPSYPVLRVNAWPGLFWISQYQIEPLAKVFPFLIKEVVYYFQDGPLIRLGFPSSLFKTNSLNEAFKHLAICREPFDKIFEIHFDAPNR